MTKKNETNNITDGVPSVPTSKTTTTTEYYGDYNIERTDVRGGKPTTKVTVHSKSKWVIWGGSSQPEPEVYEVSPEPQYKGLTVIEQQNLDRAQSLRNNTNTLVKALDHVEFTSRYLNKRIDRLNWLLTLSFSALALASALSLINLFI